MKRNLALLTAVLVLLFLGACSLDGTTGQVKDWVNNSIEDIITQTDGGISIPALGGMGVNAMVEERLNELNNDNTEEKAIARMEEILEAIETQDSDAIYDMFSINARDEAVELRERIDNLFRLMDGSVVSWEKFFGSKNVKTNHGSKSNEYIYGFDVYTDQSNYVFSIEEYLQDTGTPNNVGLYSIAAYDRARIDELSTFTEPGIYLLD